MHTTLTDAMNDRPWSVGAAVRDLELIVDDEGRPLSERRAPSVAKIGVPMVLKPCPYADERRGISMNVSALAQITHHLDEVLAEIAGFHASALAPDPSWLDVFTIVVDQLAGPALHLLRARQPQQPLPAVVAVGHKLAEGYYGVVRSLVALEAAGHPRPVTVDDLLSLVRDDNALVGASEACAGPPHMIERVTAVLLSGQFKSRTALPAWRTSIAKTLCAQLAIGIAWDWYDRETSRALLVDEIGRSHMRARNHFMAGILDEQLSRLHDETPGCSGPAGHVDLISASEPRLRAYLCDTDASGLDDALVGAIEQLHGHGDGAVRLLEPSHIAVLSRRAVRYLATYRELLAGLFRHEMVLRDQLGFPKEVPVRFNTAVLPRCRALELLEAILGHQLDCEPAAEPTVTLRNHRRSLTLPI